MPRTENIKGFSLSLPEGFMRQFRWITPVLLLMLNVIVVLLLFIGKGFVDDVKEMKNDLINMKVHVAKIEGFLRIMRAEDASERK